jgi:hypothetical protein
LTFTVERFGAQAGSRVRRLDIGFSYTGPEALSHEALCSS